MDNQNDGSPRAGVYPGAGRSQISRPHATQATDMIVAPTTRRHVMFEQLFTKPGTIGRYQAAPLVEPRERYLRHLAESGASRLTLRQIALDQVRLLHVLDLSEGEKVTVSRIEAIAPKWDRTRHHKLGHRRATSQKSTKRALSRATRWLRFLGWLDELEEERHPYGVEAGAFEEWMCTERGCSEEAISGKLGSVNEFFDWLATSGKPLALSRTRFSWTQNWLNRSVQGGPEHDR